MVLLLLLAMLWGGSQAQNPNYKLNMQADVKLQKGLCAFLPCTITYPKDHWEEETTACGYWYREVPPKSPILVATNCESEKVHQSTKGRFQLLGDPSDWSCSLLIKDVQESDWGVYYFRVERGPKVRFNYMNYKLLLQVTDLTQKPDIYILEPLWPGRRGTVICVFNATSEKCPAPTFSWEGAAVSSRRTQASTHMSSVLTLEPRAQDRSIDLTCRVRFAPSGARAERTRQLEVAYSPKDLVISVSQAEGAAPQPQGRDSPLPLQARKGQFLQLLCEADSKPDATLSWALEDRVVSFSRPQGPKALALVLPAVTERDAGTYTCRAENLLGAQSRALHLDVQYPPENLRVMISLENRTVLETSSRATSFGVLQGQSLQLLCVAQGNPPANVSWAGSQLVPSPAQPPDPGLLLLPQVQLDQEGEFTCTAQNLLGVQRVSVDIRVHYEKGSLSKAFSSGALMSGGVSALLCLCIILILVKTLKRKKTKGEKAERLSRRSTILDYINVFPRVGPRTQNRETKPSGPQPPVPAPSSQAWTNRKQKQQCPVGPRGHPGPTASTQALQSIQDEVHYSSLCFHECRAQEPQEPKERQEEYAEIRFR
ncbi:sialic acid-binding Ig-like lectin 10 [Sorex fumeus]|uniref:sialic acid-binding Ig-like lectin 10 n=1 Tax=Sorex fumeus TaxID=62283 RepID=UPI0024ACA717|nr:sialic acid-binding Ig-like lectin 10 [Sorex fumeus]